MPSSQQTRAYHNVMSESNIKKNWSAKKRANCKAHKHTNLLQVSHLPLTSFSTKFLKDNCVVFDASHNKQHIDICKEAKVIDVSKLKIIDTTRGQGSYQVVRLVCLSSCWCQGRKWQTSGRIFSPSSTGDFGEKQ